ncbi:transposase [Rhodosalinus halophilus]|uniref:Transposase n=1 Tax=Rhodosalinus halophilus TaxID=2259333 RepID=A0A365U6A1_9RHOB|nr:transposase [Rhodosalinus halophilus]RBI84035.1 transposase [Rhodosalinus halophilus]
MPDYIRPRIPGATIFFTVALRERGSEMLVHEIARLRDAVRRTRSERPFRIDAWVVLPDHLHAVWTLPEGDADFATRWRLIKARFSRGLPAGPRRPSDVARGERAIWQRRFWEHHVRGEAEYRAFVRYCHLNPVRHGLAETPEAWPFSTVHREIRAGRWP